MNLIRALLITTLLTAGMVSHASKASTPAASPSVRHECPVTTPTAERPPENLDPFDDDASLHREDGIWVTIPKDGVVELSPDDEISFGPLTGWRSASVQWLRDEGVEGFVEVSGERLDEESDFSPQTPLSPQRQYVRVGPVTTGLAFPTSGCWKVRGTVTDHEITWVVDVRFMDGA